MSRLRRLQVGEKGAPDQFTGRSALVLRAVIKASPHVCVEAHGNNLGGALALWRPAAPNEAFRGIPALGFVGELLKEIVAERDAARRSTVRCGHGLLLTGGLRLAG